MGFLPPEPLQHICPTPLIWRLFRGSLAEGTRWRCEECGEIWIIRRSARHDWRFWTREHPKPPRPPSGAGGIVTRRTT